MIGNTPVTNTAGAFFNLLKLFRRINVSNKYKTAKELLGA